MRYYSSFLGQGKGGREDDEGHAHGGHEDEAGGDVHQVQGFVDVICVGALPVVTPECLVQMSLQIHREAKSSPYPRGEQKREHLLIRSRSSSISNLIPWRERGRASFMISYA